MGNHVPTRHRSGRFQHLCGCLVLACTPATAGEADSNWSGRFLGGFALSQQAIVAAPVMQPGFAAPLPAPQPLPSPQAGTAASRSAGTARLWQHAPAIDLSLSPQVGAPSLAPAGQSGLHLLAPLPEGGPETGFGLGWGVEVSPRVYVQGGVLGSEDPGGSYSLSRENRYLSLSASFRF
ncbi:hypothetical protein MHM88_02120 [Epibacterium sp. MM17-32]|uniref:hypothetical protein n=1 Tax=Epibacterium sp. MM17-32 TaxID=2917734 RepID=UPI001EF65AED|nr:hypothetical protein [Epibacterium sp. MM17-32]MCG7626585.1 hypothetical protein [Epibacterium sp. MM17-32]